MPPDASLRARPVLPVADRIPAAWSAPLLRLALAWLALILLTAHDWLTMAGKWWSISTYNHVLFVPIILGWLVWSRRASLAKLEPHAWWPGVVTVAGALFVWLLGRLAGLDSASQLGAVVALQGAILAILGPRVAAALLFPLGYMLFLVPFGDELVPMLQTITAKIVVALTHASGIPATIDGVFIDTPAGLFEVAEACSGVQFLVAMAALGALVAQTCFLSPRRRAVFLAAALALPIVANGVRAWGTIYIAQSQGIAFAAGFDHVFYGWIFFALVVAALLGVSWRWFDRPIDHPPVDLGAIGNSALLDRLGGLSIGGRGALVWVLGLVLLAGIWANLATRVEAALPTRIALPSVPSWQRVPYRPEVPWSPRASAASHRLLGRYRNAAGETVDVFVALYPAQDEVRDAAAYGEGAFVPDTPWRWLEAGRGNAQAHEEVLLALGRQLRVAQTSYRTGDLTTGSPLRLKLAAMRDSLLLRPRATTTLILSVEGRERDEAERVLAKFTRSIGDHGSWMDRIAGLR